MLLLLPLLLQRMSRLLDWRRTLHHAPELAFAEHATTALIRDALRDLPEIPLPTATGAAFLVDGGPGPRVLVRADIDALPVTEATGLPFASGAPGVMHACGHDAHVAMVLGLAGRLAADPPAGSVVLLFQPAEEILAGAAAVLDILDGVDAVLGAHVTPMLPTGTFGIRPGALLAGAIGYAVEIRGGGGHGALRRGRGDALAAAAALVPRLAAGSAELPAVTVCRLHAGEAANVTPERAELNGTLRYATEPAALWAGMQQTVADHAAEHGVDAQLIRTFGAPPVVNHPGATAAVSGALATHFSLGALRWLPRTLPTSDDFAELLTRRPGCYFLIGAAAPDPATRIAHSPRFDIDEAALPVGVDALAAATLALIDATVPRSVAIA